MSLPDFKILFSKLPPTLYYLQHGKEEVAAPVRRPRPAAELEVRPGRNREDQISVVVASLLDDQKSEALDSLKTIFANSIAEMRAWESEVEGRRLVDENGDDQGEPPARQSTSMCIICILRLTKA